MYDSNTGKIDLFRYEKSHTCTIVPLVWYVHVHCINKLPLVVLCVRWSCDCIAVLIDIGKVIHSMTAHLDAVTGLAVDPHGLYLLSGGRSHHLSLSHPSCHSQAFPCHYHRSWWILTFLEHGLKDVHSGDNCSPQTLRRVYLQRGLSFEQAVLCQRRSRRYSKSLRLTIDVERLSSIATLTDFNWTFVPLSLFVIAWLKKKELYSPSVLLHSFRECVLGCKKTGRSWHFWFYHFTTCMYYRWEMD